MATSAVADAVGGHQLDLFESERLAWDAEFATARRVQLDETSWIEHVPAWLSGGELLFEQLRREAAWEQRERWMVNRVVAEPRLTAEYPAIGDAPEPVREIAAALSAHYGVLYDGVWINLYRGHRDGTGWHGDWPSCKRPECVVPVLSLGASRRFLIRPREGGSSIGFTPSGGDLVVMGGAAQRDFRHMVPKQARPAGPRISVNFTSSQQARRGA